MVKEVEANLCGFFCSFGQSFKKLKNSSFLGSENFFENSQDTISSSSLCDKNYDKIALFRMVKEKLAIVFCSFGINLKMDLNYWEREYFPHLASVSFMVSL